jgi:hypothetical protein
MVAVSDSTQGATIARRESRATVTMAPPLKDVLTPEKALIFRITHRDNLPWLLANGLHCRKSDASDPKFVNIGNPDLIDKRHRQPVPVAPNGTLSDYVPFYFTPLSTMAFNIHTGHNGIRKRDSREIVILVSSLRKLEKDGVRFLFTDRHASVAGARFTHGLHHLDWIDWDILQRRDFSRDNEDIGKTSRYQAEALVHKSIPAEMLMGVACYDADQKTAAESLIEERGLRLKAIANRGWFF